MLEIEARGCERGPVLITLPREARRMVGANQGLGCQKQKWSAEK